MSVREQRWESWDALRGLMLALMLVTHFPSQFSARVGQPFGFVSSAEGFVLLAAFLVGRISATLAAREGFDHASRWLWRRAAKVYGAHVALLALLFGLLVPYALTLGDNPVVHLSSYFIEHPRRALAEAAVLLYQPPLLDILPMYVLFLAGTPLLIGTAQRCGWPVVLVASVALWLAAQLGAEQRVHAWATLTTGWKSPYSATGAFVLMAWQLLWVAGVCAGQRTLSRSSAFQVPPGLARAAFLLAALFFVWRHAAGQVPFPGAHPELNAWFDKWHLGPLRLLDLAALLVVLHRWGPALGRQRGLVVPLAFLGRASLPVFCVHLVICMAALAFLGQGPRPPVVDAALLAGAFAIMALTARIFRQAATGRSGGPARAISARGAR